MVAYRELSAKELSLGRFFPRSYYRVLFKLIAPVLSNVVDTEMCRFLALRTFGG